MADSIRQQIMTALDTRMKAILTAGGYETDLGTSVFEWRTENLDDSQLPALVWRDIAAGVSDQADDGAAMGSHAHALTVEIEIITSGSTAPAAVRKMIADVYKAIGVDDTWGGLALATAPREDETEHDQAEKKIAGATIRAVIIYETLSFDPYTQPS